MKQRKDIKHKKMRKFVCLLSVILLLALFLQAGILAVVNRKNANQTLQVLLDQVTNIIEKNQKDENDLIQSLKEDYIVRAKAVSYMIDHNPSAEYNRTELQKMANLMSIDEIHLIDTTGTIYSGTIPKYYGLNFNDGEQIAYFKAMLKDKRKSMCQDVMPNTSEGKKMMYATTWNNAGDKMVQVGIRPKRLLEQVRQNEVSNVVSNMPVYDGVDIYVADLDSGKIRATTDTANTGKTLDDIGIAKGKLPAQDALWKNIRINGEKQRGVFQKAGDYVVCVTLDSSVSDSKNLIAVLMVAVYLGLAGICILIVISRLLDANREKQEQFAVLSSMADIYHSMHLINLEQNTAIEYSESSQGTAPGQYYKDADEMMRQIVETTAIEAYVESVERFTNLHTIAERMQDKKVISGEFVGQKTGWFRASFITIERNKEQKPVKVIFTIQSIDDEKRKEEQLIHTSNTDNLTGCFNRRAYDADFHSLSLDTEFIYVSMDVNGLKIVNDSLGHAAGDELLLGAAECMYRAFDEYGKVYRIGGDEFIAIIFTDAQRFKEIEEHFETCVNQWYGKQIQSMTISFGYVSSREKNWKSMTEIAHAADVRMYERKAMYYRQNGVDRRGQPAAYLALFRLYANILKINLNDNSYRILNWENQPETSDALPMHLSEWLQDDKNIDAIHPDDRADYLRKTSVDYLREAFDRSQRAVSISYRSRQNGEEHRMDMEIIPVEDYGAQNRIAFLYLKSCE